MYAIYYLSRITGGKEVVAVAEHYSMALLFKAALEEEYETVKFHIKEVVKV